MHVSRFYSSLVVVTLAALSLGITGCSSHAKQPEPPPQPSAIRTITLNPNVIIVEKPEFKPDGGAITGALNAMGAKLGNPRVVAIQDIIRRGNVDVRQIVLDSMRNELQKSEVPVKIVERDGEADLQLSVEAYGMHRGLEMIVVPSIDLRASLVRTDGVPIWDAKEYVDQRHEFRDGVHTNTFDMYEREPDLFKVDFAANVARVAKELVEDLKEDHANGDIGKDDQ